MDDLADDEDWSTNAERLESAGDFALELEAGEASLLAADLQASPEFVAAANRAGWLFDRTSGLVSAHPEVRAMRRDAVGVLLESMLEPLEAHEARRRSRRKRAQRRQRAREPLVRDLLPADAGEEADSSYRFTPLAREPDPGSAAAAAECAARVLEPNSSDSARAGRPV